MQRCIVLLFTLEHVSTDHTGDSSQILQQRKREMLDVPRTRRNTIESFNRWGSLAVWDMPAAEQKAFELLQGCWTGVGESDFHVVQQKSFQTLFCASSFEGDHFTYKLNIEFSRHEASDIPMIRAQTTGKRTEDLAAEILPVSPQMRVHASTVSLPVNRRMSLWFSAFFNSLAGHDMDVLMSEDPLQSNFTAEYATPIRNFTSSSSSDRTMMYAIPTTLANNDTTGIHPGLADNDFFATMPPGITALNCVHLKLHEDMKTLELVNAGLSKFLFDTSNNLTWYGSIFSCPEELSSVPVPFEFPPDFHADRARNRTACHKHPTFEKELHKLTTRAILTKSSSNKCRDPNTSSNIQKDGSPRVFNVVLIILAGTLGICLLCCMNCALGLRRLRRRRQSDDIPSCSTDSSQRRAAQQTIRGWQAVLFGRSTTSEDLQKSPSTLDTVNTEEKFKGGIKDMINLGLREQWIIPREHVRMFEIIGRGAFGKVQHGRIYESTEVAIKFALSQDTFSDKGAKRLRALGNEVRLLRRLRHENIVSFLGVVVNEIHDSLELGVVLEWIDGGTLEDYCRRHKTGCGRSSSNDHGLLLDITRGMVFLHSQVPLVLHRDLKPANILVELAEPPRAKLADFGLSTIEHSDKPVTSRAGTLVYMAPEVFTDHGYSTKADVFSFGCVVLFLLTSKHPPKDTSALDAAQQLAGIKKSEELARIACMCLQAEASTRPTFATLYHMLSLGTQNI